MKWSGPIPAGAIVQGGSTPGMTTLELRFAEVWKQCGGRSLVREWRFDPTRRWRFDFADLLGHHAFEIEGGVWTRGRHTRPLGFQQDAEKYLAAQLAGWTVWRLTEPLITEAVVRQLVAITRKHAA